MCSNGKPCGNLKSPAKMLEEREVQITPLEVLSRLEEHGQSAVLAAAYEYYFWASVQDNFVTVPDHENGGLKWVPSDENDVP
jgi:hypothetical protein